jgi:rSAM/selenodomain-associated transferase 2
MPILKALRFASLTTVLDARRDPARAAVVPSTSPSAHKGLMRLSIIVPMLNEARNLPSLLGPLLSLQQRECEVLLVDGGSQDDSVGIARSAGFPVIISECGRALQMNTGAKAAKGDILLFLHADTQLPELADQMIIKAFDQRDQRPTNQRLRQWGRFNVRIAGQHPMLKLIAWMMNWRSAWTGIATGDQAIFVRAQAFKSIGGFPQQALMEDIEFSKRIKRTSQPICLYQKVTTSGRRWEARGVWRTIALMWSLRLAYFLGVDPTKLAKRYR